MLQSAGAAGLICVLVLVTGCGAAGEAVSSGDDPSPLLMREGVIESAAGRAGTALPDGFSVAEGTTLIGDPIPAGVDLLLNGEPVMGAGWTARFTAQGDADAIMRAYLRQADELGLEELPVTEPKAAESEEYHSQPDRYGTCATVRSRTWCHAVARSPQLQPTRTMTLDLVRGSSSDQPISHLTLSYSTTERAWSHAEGSAYGDTMAPLAPPPAAWPPLPETGASFGPHLVALGRLAVAPGSQLAAAPLIDRHDGSVAILEVTGDPAQVLSAYRDQLLDAVGEASEPDRLEVAGTTLTTIYASEAGGDHYELQLVQRPGRPTWLTAAGGHD